MVLSFIPLKDDQKLPDPLSITANLTTLLNPTCGTKDKTLYVIQNPKSKMMQSIERRIDDEKKHHCRNVPGIRFGSVPGHPGRMQ